MDKNNTDKNYIRENDAVGIPHDDRHKHAFSKKWWLLLLAAAVVVVIWQLLRLQTLPKPDPGSGTVDVVSNTSGSSTPEADSDSASGIADDLELTESGKLHMATDIDYPPFEYVNDDGTYTGIDIEIAAKIAEKLGLELAVDPMNFDEILSSTEEGEEDIAMSGITATEERKQVLDFTEPYYETYQAAVAVKNSNAAAAAGVEDLEGLVIGCQTASTTEAMCQIEFGSDHSISSFADLNSAVTQMRTGAVDILFMSEELADYYVSGNDDLVKIEGSDAWLESESYAIGIKKDHSNLYQAVSDALNDLIADGTVRDVIDRFNG
ncbi:MAG: amino acid ABC transporter substrate-binding protein [Eubacterium sp.]|nr:amino acid ABC transporter substrate-binding protein [Eubacterium sp.]